VTAAPDWVSVAFQICETVCEPGHEYPTLQPLIALPPESVTVKPSWKPPLHELVTDQVAVQPPDEPEALAEGEEERDELGDEDGLAEALADALALGLAERDGLADGEPEGEEPLPLLSTTTDCAGIVSEPPENVLCAMVGLAAL